MNHTFTVAELQQKKLRVEREKADTEAEIGPLTRRLDRLNQEIACLESKILIIENKIKKEEVELSDGEGKPYFGNIYTFAKWLKENSRSVWVEWNGSIYRTSDFLEGNLSHPMGRVSNLG